MKMYWTLKDIPELADLPRAERRRLWWRVSHKRLRYRQNWVALLIALGCAALGITVIGALVDPAVGGAIGGGLGGLLYSQMTIPLVRPHLRAARAAGVTGTPPASGEDVHAEGREG